MTPMSKRIYVLDTSVLLADPKSMTRFEEHDVVLPVVVVLELESKRNHPELGWSARQALRQLEYWRVNHGSLTTPFPVNDVGGTLRVEINHQDLSALPPSLAGDSNDHRILAVARNLAAEGNQVTVVTKDLPLRLKASIVGLTADEYRNELARDDSWTGIVELECESAAIDELFDHGSIEHATSRAIPALSCTQVHNPLSPEFMLTSHCILFDEMDNSSMFAAAPPNSESQLISSPIHRLASCRSVVPPVPGKVFSHLRPDSSRFLSNAATSASSSFVRSMQLAAKTSGISRVQSSRK
jgi:predicted ribonuclease YlaK